MALVPTSLHRRTETISFNPYRNPTSRPSEDDSSRQTGGQVISSNEFNTRIGLGAGLSAFVIAIVLLSSYCCYRRSRRRRLRLEVGEERMIERHRIARVVPDTSSPRSIGAAADNPEPTGEREISSIAGGTTDNLETRPKAPSTNVLVDGHGQGESSTSGGNMQAAQEAAGVERATHQSPQALQDLDQNQRYTK